MDAHALLSGHASDPAEDVLENSLSIGTPEPQSFKGIGRSLHDAGREP